MLAQFIRPPRQPIRDGATPKNVAEATRQGYAGRDNSPFLYRFNFLTIGVQPHPQDPVCGQEPRSTFALSPQDGHLMSQGNKFKFQGGAAANTEFEDRNKRAENRHHVCDGTAAAGKTLVFLDSSKF
jgi:hypothetical protein